MSDQPINPAALFQGRTPSNLVEVIPEKGFARLIMRRASVGVVDRWFIGVERHGFAAQPGDIAVRRLRLGQKRVKTTLQVSVIARPSAEIPNELGRAYGGDGDTCDLSPNGELRAECSDGTGPQQNGNEQRRAMPPLPPCFLPVMIERRIQQVEAKPTYRGGLIGGGFPTGDGRDGGGADGPLGVGLCAHRTSPFANMSSKNLLFFGDVAGRVVPAARPATQRSPRWASLQLPQKGQVV